MRQGFSLIEVLVTMAIVSILAGIMVPSVWKWWESQEEQTTRERVQALKLAMVGDRTQIQNGIRTSYGFVGDYGELPVQGQLSSPSLRSYIPGGYHADAYNDAWGRRLTYTVFDNLPGYDGRFLSGQICSNGLDGIAGSKDDICVDIPVSEVAPTHRIQGNFTFSGVMPSYSSARLELTFKNPNEPSGESLSMQSACKSKNSASFPNFTTIFRNPANPLNLPIGKTTIQARAYQNLNCSGSEKASGSMDYFISDNLSRLLINLPPIP
jgi:prepilin-type N-terminal cleavage/methylation domain-containing protein